MKATRIKEIFKNIKHSLSNFISITMFIFLGIAIFQALDFSGNAVKYSFDKSYRNQNASDIQISYVLGCSQSEIDEFNSNEHITVAEGSFTANEYLVIDDNKRACAINSMTNDIDQPILVEGRLPERDNEIVFLERSAKGCGLNVGDTVTFSDGNGFSNYILTQLRDIRQRTDIINIPSDITTNFLNNTFKIVGFVNHPSYFCDGSSYYGTYPNSAAPIDLIGYVKYSALNPKVTGGHFNNVVLRSDEVRNIDCFTQKYKGKVREIVSEINPLAQRIAKARYDACKENMDVFLNIEGVVTKIADILKALHIISDETYQDFNEIKELVENYSGNLAKVESVSPITRDQSPVFIIGGAPSDITLKIKYIMGGALLIIALLICFSSINRLVNDEVKQIGTKKALGFRKGEIIFTYVGYTLAAVIIGLILGNAFALLFESILVPIMGTNVLCPLVITHVNPWLIVLMIAIVTVAIEGITVLACTSRIKRRAIELLAGNTEVGHKKTKFYEKTKLWSKMRLIDKTIVNNTINNKKRCLSTIIGIASCVMMTGGSLMVDRNVIRAFKTQNNTYMKFDYFVYFNPAISGACDNILSYFEEKEVKASPVYRDMAYLSLGDGKQTIGNVMVYYDVASFDQIITLDSINKTEFDHHGLWLPESIKKGFDLKGDQTAKILTVSGSEANIEIEGYYKNYSYYPMAFMNAEEYEAAFGSAPIKNAVMVNMSGLDIEQVREDLKAIDGFESLQDYQWLIRSVLNIFESLAGAVVALYSTVAILMGIFVILNLLMTFVEEKKRELITLRINGLSFGKASQLIYIDTIIMTVVALIIGTLGGVGLGNLAIGTFESELIWLLHTPDLVSILFGCGVTILIVAVMVILALNKAKRFKLTDINASTN